MNEELAVCLIAFRRVIIVAKEVLVMIVFEVVAVSALTCALKALDAKVIVGLGSELTCPCNTLE